MSSKDQPSQDEILSEARRVVEMLLKPREENDWIGFGADVFQYVEPVAATLGTPMTLTFRLRIPPQYGNRAGSLHGGAVAMIFDNLTSVAISLWALMSAPQGSALQDTWIISGVTRTLNCSYVRPAPVGSEVLVENEVVSAGKNIALARGVMKDPKTGKILNTCEHHKVAVPRATALSEGPKL